MPLFTVDQIAQTARELAEKFGPPPAVPAELTPSPVPNLLPPEAPPSQPHLATAGPQAAAPVVAAGAAPPTAEPPKRGRGRPPKAATSEAPAASQAASTAAPVVAAVAVAGAEDSEPAQRALEVFVDCVPDGAYQSLHGYVDGLNRVLSERHCKDAQGRATIQDVRCAPKGTPLEYNGWIGAVRECVIASPPPAGAWMLNARDNSLAEVVADALRQVCRDRGGLYVRGTR